jgi:hypothetical protein
LKERITYLKEDYVDLKRLGDEGDIVEMRLKMIDFMRDMIREANLIK